MLISSPWICRLLIAALLFLSNAGYLGAADAGPTPGTYRILNGKADWGTYAGWFTYHLSCHMCHGQDASGTDVAPDLRKSLKTMTPEQFANIVLGRYRILDAPAKHMIGSRKTLMPSMNSRFGCHRLVVSRQYALPKISTGMVSGRMIRLSIAPAFFRPLVTAAASVAIMLSAAAPAVNPTA